MANSFPVKGNNGNEDHVVEIGTKMNVSNQDSTAAEWRPGLTRYSLRSNGNTLNRLNNDEFKDIHTNVVYRRLKS